MSVPVGVLIVDDHPIVRAGVRSLAERDAAFEIVGEAGSCAEALACARLRAPDLVVADLKLPDGDGLHAVENIRTLCPAVRVVVLTSCLGDEHLRRALDKGCEAIVLKEFAEAQLVDAMRAVTAGRRHIDADVLRLVRDSAERVVLTQRERDVLRHLAAGRRNVQIGDLLGMSEATARTHVERLLQKFGCRDRGRAVSIALRRGFLTEADFAPRP